jgi:hypothetical protein
MDTDYDELLNYKPTQSATAVAPSSDYDELLKYQPPKPPQVQPPVQPPTESDYDELLNYKTPTPTPTPPPDPYFAGMVDKFNQGYNALQTVSGFVSGVAQNREAERQSYLTEDQKLAERMKDARREYVAAPVGSPEAVAAQRQPELGKKAQGVDVNQRPSLVARAVEQYGTAATPDFAFKMWGMSPVSESGEAQTPGEVATDFLAQTAGTLTGFGAVSGGLKLITKAFKIPTYVAQLASLYKTAPKLAKIADAGLRNATLFGTHSQIYIPVDTTVTERAKALGQSQIDAALFTGAGLAPKLLQTPAMAGVGWVMAGENASQEDRAVSMATMVLLHLMGQGAERIKAIRETSDILKETGVNNPVELAVTVLDGITPEQIDSVKRQATKVPPSAVLNPPDRVGKFKRFGPRPAEQPVKSPIQREDYKGQHRPVTIEGGAARLDDLTPAFGLDIYGKDAVRYFGTGDTKLDGETVNILQSLKGKPDADVKVYRAIPKEVNETDLKQGDWVTVNKDYAEQHGQTTLGGNHKIITQTVRARDLTTNADSFHEQGYYPSEVLAPSETQIGEQPIVPQPTLPVQPRQPTQPIEAQATTTRPTAEPASILNTIWYRGIPPEGKDLASGDTFYSASKGVADEYASQLGQDKRGKVSEHGKDIMPKNPLVIESKEVLAENMGIDDPFNKDFDAKAKAYAQDKGYDGIYYENGTTDFNTGELPPELHVFPQPTPAAPPTPAKAPAVQDKGETLIPSLVKTVVTNHPLYGHQPMEILEEYHDSYITKTEGGHIAVVSKDGTTVFFPAMDEDVKPRRIIKSADNVETARKYLDWRVAAEAKNKLIADRQRNATIPEQKAPVTQTAPIFKTATKPATRTDIKKARFFELRDMAKSAKYESGETAFDHRQGNSQKDLLNAVLEHRRWYNESMGKKERAPISKETRAKLSRAAVDRKYREDEIAQLDSVAAEAYRNGDNETARNAAMAANELRGKTEDVTLDSLKPGDTFTLDGEQHRVMAETDTSLRIKDGVEFSIPYEQDGIIIDKGSLKHNQPPEVVKATEPKAPGELFSESEKPFNLAQESSLDNAVVMAEQAKTAAQKAQQETAQVKMDLTGQPPDSPYQVGQTVKLAGKNPRTAVITKISTDTETGDVYYDLKPNKGDPIGNATERDFKALKTPAPTMDQILAKQRAAKVSPLDKLSANERAAVEQMNISEGEKKKVAERMLAKKMGPGAANPEDISESFGLQERVIAPLNEALGRKPEVKGEPVSDETVTKQALDNINADPNHVTNLVKNLQSNPHPLNNLEVVTLSVGANKLLQVRNAAAERTNQAAAKGDEPARIKAQEEFMLAAKEVDDILDVTARGHDKSVSEMGRALRQLRVLRDEEFKVITMESNLKARQGGKPLTPEQMAEVQRLHGEWVKAQGEVETGKTERTKAATDTTMRDIEQKARKQSKVDPDKVLTRIRNALAADPELTVADMQTDLQKLALYLEQKNIDANKGKSTLTHEELVTQLHELIRREMPTVRPDEIRDALTGYGQVRYPSKDVAKTALRGHKAELLKVAPLETVQKNIAELQTKAKQAEIEATKHTGYQRDQATARARELTKQLNNAMKEQDRLMGELGIKPDDSAQRLKSGLDAKETRLTNEIADIDRAIAENKRLVKAQPSVLMNEKIKALEAKRAERKAQYDEIFPEQPITDQQRLDRAIKVAARSLADWTQRAIDAAAGKFKTKEPGKPLPESDKLMNIIKEREAAKVEVQRLRDIAFPKKSAHEIALQTYRTRTENRIKFLEDKMARNDFTTPQRDPLDISGEPKALAAQAKLGEIKQRYDNLKKQAWWNTLGHGEKTWVMAKGVYESIRNLRYAFDNSILGRQGWWMLLSHPKEVWAKAVLPSTAAASKTQSMKYAAEFDERPNHKNGFDDISGLSYNKADKSGNYLAADDRQELNVTRRVPGIDASGRMYATGANLIRGGAFDFFLANTKTGARLTRNPKNLSAQDKQFLKDIAQGVNIFTGRSKLKNAGGSVRLLGAPSFLKSAFELMAFKPIWGAKTAEARMVFAKEYARIGGVMTMMYLLAHKAGADIDFHPTSGKFGDITLPGGYYFNPFNYVKSKLVFTARMIQDLSATAGALSTGTNRKTNNPYSADSGKTVFRFAQSVAHPGASSTLSAFTGRQFSGEPVTKTSMAKDALAPLSPSQTFDYMGEGKNKTGGAIMSILNLVGFPVGIDYEDKSRHTKPSVPKAPSPY